MRIESGENDAYDPEIGLPGRRGRGPGFGTRGSDNQSQHCHIRGRERNSAPLELLLHFFGSPPEGLEKRLIRDRLAIDLGECSLAGFHGGVLYGYL